MGKPSRGKPLMGKGIKERVVYVSRTLNLVYVNVYINVYINV